MTQEREECWFAVCPRFPRPDTASGDARWIGLLRRLARHVAVDLCVLETPEPPEETAPWIQDWERAGIRVTARGLVGFHDRLATQAYQVVLAEFWYCAERVFPLVERVQPWARRMVDSVDVAYLREQSALAISGTDPAVEKASATAITARRERELGVYRKADGVVVVTGEDARELRSQGVGGPLVEVRNFVELRARSPGPRPPGLVFIGGFRHAPNRDAILWFAEEIFPQVRAAIPSVRLRIVGSHAPPEVVRLGERAGVEVIGQVPEVGRYLDEASVSIAPLRFGAGMKGKVTEAMAAGVPVVTTSFGAQGLGAEPERDLLLAEDPAGFADAVVRCLRDPDAAEALGRRGQQRIAEVCGEPAADRAIEALREVARATGIPAAAGPRLAIYRAARRVYRALRRSGPNSG